MYHKPTDRIVRLTAVLLLITTGAAHAVICKSVDADGVISYTDVPRAECANPIKLPEYSRYAPRLLPDAAAEASSAPDTEPFTGYDVMRIVQPKTGDAVRNDEGKVPVIITLEPGLQDSHRVTLTVNGQAL